MKLVFTQIPEHSTLDALEREVIVNRFMASGPDETRRPRIMVRATPHLMQVRSGSTSDLVAIPYRPNAAIFTSRSLLRAGSLYHTKNQLRQFMGVGPQRHLPENILYHGLEVKIMVHINGFLFSAWVDTRSSITILSFSICRCLKKVY